MSENRPTPPAPVDSISTTTSAPASSPHDSNAPTTINVPGIQDTAENMPTAQGKSKRKSRTSASVTNKYQSKAYDRFLLQVKSGDKEKIQAYATAHGLTVNALIIQAINAHCGDIITPLAKNPYI